MRRQPGCKGIPYSGGADSGRIDVFLSGGKKDRDEVQQAAALCSGLVFFSDYEENNIFRETYHKQAQARVEEHEGKIRETREAQRPRFCYITLFQIFHNGLDHLPSLVDVIDSHWNGSLWRN